MVHMRIWVAAVPNRKGKLVLWVGGQANKNNDRFEQKFKELVDEIRTELEGANAVPSLAQAQGTAGAHSGWREVDISGSATLERRDGGKRCRPGHESYKWNQPAPTGGNALLVLVGLGVVFLLIAALLGAAKAGGSLFSESNLLYVALIFYAGAGALYMGFGVTGTARYVKFASIGNGHRLSCQHSGRRASLVSGRTSALRQHL